MDCHPIYERPPDDLRAESARIAEHMDDVAGMLAELGRRAGVLAPRRPKPAPIPVIRAELREIDAEIAGGLARARQLAVTLYRCPMCESTGCAECGGRLLEHAEAWDAYHHFTSTRHGRRSGVWVVPQRAPNDG